MGKGKLPAEIRILIRPLHPRKQGGGFKIREKAVPGKDLVTLAATDKSFNHGKYPNS
jgi:hypothetical protein